MIKWGIFCVIFITFQPEVLPQSMMNTDSLLNYLDTIYVEQPRTSVDTAGKYFYDNSITDVKVRARLALHLGAGYYYLAMPDSSLHYQDTALVLAKKTGDKTLLANVYTARSIVNLHLGNYVKCISINRKTLKIYRQMKDTLAIANSLRGLANVYQKLNYNDSAVTYNLRALNLLKNRDDKESTRSKSGILMNLGISLLESGDTTRGLRYYKKAENLYRERGDQQNLARLYHNYGNIFQSRNKPDTALKYFRKAVRLKKEHHLERKLGSSLYSIAKLYTEKNQTNKAKAYYLQAINMSSAVGDVKNHIFSLSYLIRLHLDQNALDSASFYIQKLKEKKSDLRSNPHKEVYYRTLAKYHEKTGSHKKALETYKKYKTFHDTIRNTEMIQTTQELEKKYQATRKEKENIRLKNEVIQQEHEKARQRAYLVISLIGIVSLMIVVFLLVKLLRTRSRAVERQKKLRETEKEKAHLEIKEYEQRVSSEKEIRRLREEKYQKDLEIKNRELAASAMQISNKNKLLEEIQQISQSTQGDEINKKVSRLLSTNYSNEEEWEQLMMHFEKVHPGFFDKLRNKFSDLTDYDLRLAAYLKINLNSKEIAQVLNITPSAVKKSRQRLRKKMDLPGEIDFAEYFNHEI
ncbi:MAG: tetratricopeptide repeat protein [Bacteroidales bacterium]|nr:tetratricopeptide repeat protein [Bacteroidales bacterium]